MSLTPTLHRTHQLLAHPLNNVRGVGPRILQLFSQMGISTIEDALYTLPLRYEDRRELRKIANLRENLQEVFWGEIIAAGETLTARSRKKLFEVIVSDGTGQVALKWFHYKKAWIKNRFAIGKKAIFIGDVKRFGSIREVHHPDVEFFEGEQTLESLALSDPLSFGRIIPVYPLTKGLHQKAARKIWKQVVDHYAPVVVSPMPVSVVEKRHLLPVGEALQSVHWPKNDTNISDLCTPKDQARRTLVYDEFFYLELGLALKRQGIVLEKGIAFEVNHRYTIPLAKMLPYKLTDAQRRVLGEIKNDLIKPHPMNRLVQGDVGSGKTIVALMASLLAIENNTQVAVVAPTEILAEQHYLNFHGWMQSLGLRVELLSGSMKGQRKKEVLAGIGDGSIHMVVGTHAVLQKGVEFKRLGFGVIDEQHRFGVAQRGVLRHKGENPHILVMTATPIPRTLSLTLYGDLALSVIDELPPGRTPISTHVVSEKQRRKAYATIHKELKSGHQAYIVYPLVEESEKSDLKAATVAAEHLQEEEFPDYRIGLLHGRMSPEEKETTMAAFKNREIDILVSTTVIEVGIDVPNASVMMIEHAERFGLAQLHQLRGRVGRGAAKSYCLLMRNDRCSEEGFRRLQVMAETNDGFRIAEADLEIRGPGEFLGTRQAGLPDFRVANLLRDGRILEEAREDAFELANRPDFLTTPQYEELRTELLHRWGSRLELASIG